MTKKLRVVVLMGGKSPEHDVSILSGKNVISALNKNGYEVFPVVISKDGKHWKLINKRSSISVTAPLFIKENIRENVLSNKHGLQGAESIFKKYADIVFIAMHGPFGEDGTVQRMLDLIGYKYTGSGFLASILGMDKLMFREIMIREKIAVPKYEALSKNNFKEDMLKYLEKPPYFVKPNNQGSSIGTSIANNRKELKSALNLAWKYSQTALVEEYLCGMEITCGVLGNDKPKALPLVEIIPRSGKYFDFKSKYTESGSEEVVPARISKKMTEIIQRIAVNAHLTIGCRGFSRVDFILKDNKIPIVLEINTIPDLTPLSLLPKAAKAAGISYRKLIGKIINYALK